MRKLISIILVILCLFALIACTTVDDDPLGGWDKVPTDTTVDTQAPDPLPTETESPDSSVMPTPDTGEGTIDYLQITIGEDYKSIKSLLAYANNDGTIHIEYVGEYKKVGDFELSVEDKILAAIEASGLKTLNGVNNYLDGEANGSMYVSYKDGTYLGAGFSGNVPDEYKHGYAILDECFKEIVKDLPIYVPQPIVQGNIHPDDMEIIMSILDNANIEYIDSYVINEVPRDEYFAYQLGLSSDEGVLRGVSFGSVMITNAYSLSMVVLDEGTSVDKIVKDFEKNINWRKWVCVAPNYGMIAVKDNVVICLLGSDPVYTKTKSAIETAGFEAVDCLTNPDLQYVAAPEKPVIYLYPTEETNVTVRLDFDGKLTHTYPIYNGGWTVTAQPDGTLTDENGREYYCLFWEGVANTQYDMTKGFVVAGDETRAFLESSLEKLGLTDKEANEFIIYWLPQMENNAYNLISFQTTAYTDNAKLTIDPFPDTVIRVFMSWKALEEPISIEPQSFTTPERIGFTVVEWGGAEIK